MTDFQLRGKCETCSNVRWFIRKRKIPVAGAIATSKKLMCGNCFKVVKDAISNKTLTV